MRYHTNRQVTQPSITVSYKTFVPSVDTENKEIDDTRFYLHTAGSITITAKASDYKLGDKELFLKRQQEYCHLISFKCDINENENPNIQKYTLFYNDVPLEKCIEYNTATNSWRCSSFQEYFEMFFQVSPSARYRWFMYHAKSLESSKPTTTKDTLGNTWISSETFLQILQKYGIKRDKSKKITKTGYCIKDSIFALAAFIQYVHNNRETTIKK